MIDSLRSRRASLKWRPRQKFVLTESGKTARQGYEQAIAALPRGDGARDALAAAQGAWASPLAVLPADATVLAEVGEAPKLHRQLHDAVSDAGLTLADVQDAVDRLYKAGLVAPADGIPPEERGNA